MTEQPQWEVINYRTRTARRYKTVTAARRAADRQDNAHGSYICSVRRVRVDVPAYFD